VQIEGEISDKGGQLYELSGHYAITIAETLDFETGVFPGTPFEVDDSFSPAVIIQPGVPAEVVIDIEHYPYSDESHKVSEKYRGLGK